MSQPFIDLRAVRAYKERRQFIERHVTKGDTFVLGFGLGCAFIGLLFAAVTILTRL